MRWPGCMRSRQMLQSFESRDRDDDAVADEGGSVREGSRRRSASDMPLGSIESSSASRLSYVASSIAPSSLRAARPRRDGHMRDSTNSIVGAPSDRRSSAENSGANSGIRITGGAMAGGGRRISAWASSNGIAAKSSIDIVLPCD